MKPSRYLFALAISLSSLLLCQAQIRQTQESNHRLSPEEFRRLAAACAPEVPLITLRAIARAESGFHLYALSLDYPQRTAKEHGFTDGGIFLAQQPKNLAEARTWTHWLLRRGRSVSIGLMQISTQHAADFGLSADQLFDPCINIRAGERVLTAQYRRAAAILGEGQEALQQALSEYNSGSSVLGLANGYVSNVVNGEFREVELRANTGQRAGGRPLKNASQDTGPCSSPFADSGAHTGKNAERTHRRGGGD